MYPTISLHNEEREELLDALSTCVDYLRDEAALAGQCFDDLCGYCPDDLRLCEPLEGVNVEGKNAAFLVALVAMGIETAQELAERSGADYEACAAVLANPIVCEAGKRARVIKALEEKAGDDLWGTPYRMGEGGTVGGFLYSWLRRNFKTPSQFAAQVKAYELKSYLVGAVGSLPNEDIESLLQAVSLVSVLKDAAALAREQRRRRLALHANGVSQKHTLRDRRRGASKLPDNLLECISKIVPLLLSLIVINF